MFDWLRSKWVAAFLVMWLFPIGPLLYVKAPVLEGFVGAVWILFVIATIAAHLHHHFLSRRGQRAAIRHSTPAN